MSGHSTATPRLVKMFRLYADPVHRYREFQQYHAVQAIQTGRCPRCQSRMTAVQGRRGPAWQCGCR